MKIVSIFLSAVIVGLGSTTDVPASDELGPFWVKYYALTDFENNKTSPWLDVSLSSTFWKVENISSPIESTNPAPTPDAGSNYLRVTRTADLQSGLAIVKCPVFTAQPGDVVSFNFWIRSQYIYGNSLKVSDSQWLAYAISRGIQK